MKLLRTIRLDASDTFAFPAAAEPGEWAVSGTFVFSDVEPAALKGKQRVAFRSGLLGFPSLGWSTLAQVVEATAEDRRAARDALAHCLLARFGAPDLAAACEAADEEIEFAASLCEHPPNTLIAVHRTVRVSAIHEAFRTLRPRDVDRRWRAFSFLDAKAEDEPIETVDLAKLTQR